MGLREPGSRLPVSHEAFPRDPDPTSQRLPCSSPPFPALLLSSHSNPCLSFSDFLLPPPLLRRGLAHVTPSPTYPPPLQGELQLLCMQLDRHISTHIRESPQAMHRTRLKDLAAQTYICWQDLLAHCQPQVAPPLAPRLGRGGK